MSVVLYLRGFNDVQEDDMIEAYAMVEVLKGTFCLTDGERRKTFYHR